MSELPPIERYQTNHGLTIYRLPMIVFPNGFVGYAYLVLGGDVPTLIDAGSGYGRSSQDLLDGLRAVREDFGEAFDVGDIRRVLITHGHVDHFGGLSDAIRAIGAPQVAIHPLDKRVLTNYEERVVVATKNLEIYLVRAGVRQERLTELMEMYGFSKKHVRSLKVDFVIDEDHPLPGMEFYHVPGHCSGQVAIRLGDVLLSADHILPRTSPHLAAESITHYTGVGHYRESLRKMATLDGIRLTLGGHESPIDDLHARIHELQSRLDLKAERVLDIIRSADHPLTISEISKQLYTDKHGFDVLLALQEAGAHVEYLYDRGYLAVANLHEFEHDDNPSLMYSVL
ncbi:MAG: MBL fold metallo-hydrolase [Anaerolineae bacterium]|nr:MBL fold metallo-hydrolase [Anaerolineae bacterium]MDW8172067.1 MBL fold metallo-hydrolase [Anaerolineae bacterium]